MRFTGVVIAPLVLLAAVPSGAAEQTFPAGSLIVPMDTTFQDHGMLEAHGLVHDLLRHGVPVDWTIAPGKAHDGIDFVADAEVLPSGLTITAHGYRGGPFVIDAMWSASAMGRVEAWRATHPQVAVHRATAPFTAEVARELMAAPRIAVLVDGGEDVAFAYLNAASVPMSDNDPWPSRRDKTEAYSCPGPDCCPDCLSLQKVAGPTTASSSDGALFDAGGVPRYSQLLAMGYRDPAADPEVVAEVRAFLAFPVLFFAHGEAAAAFENAPAGRFLTTGGLRPGVAPTAIARAAGDDPLAQADGAFAPAGGRVPSFALDMGSAYFDGVSVFASGDGAPVGTQDVWLAGTLDGDPSSGVVAYLGGHKYTTQLPASAHARTQGVRFFLDAALVTPCTSAEGQPDPATWIEAPEGSGSAQVEISVCASNDGPGVATAAVLELDLPPAAELLDGGADATVSGASVSWSVGSLAAGALVCREASVLLAGPGHHVTRSRLSYEVGWSALHIEGASVVVRVGSIDLLRRGVDLGATGMASLAERYPAVPTLDPQLDLEVVAFGSGEPFPHDVLDLLPGSPPLVLFELAGWSAPTLRAAKVGGKLVLTF